jgi:hypothetical protein
MSGRLPLGRSLKVGGNSETRLNQIVPGLLAVMTRRFSFEGAAFPVVRVTSYFFHSPVMRRTSALARTVAPLLLTISTVNGPLNPLSAFA